MAETGKLTIEVSEVESVTALWYPAARNNRAGVTIILGHGAGADQMSGFMRMAAEAWRRAGSMR
jgi:predicted alpha/beta-hydrolase family hydrolase